jgi:hypothetical protein
MEENIMAENRMKILGLCVDINKIQNQRVLDSIQYMIKQGTEQNPSTGWTEYSDHNEHSEYAAFPWQRNR